MPKPVAVMQVEGVLRNSMGGGVLGNGRRLYHGMAGTFRIVLVTFDDHPRNLLTGWLGMEGFNKHDDIVYPSYWPEPRIPVWLNIARTLTRTYGYDVELSVVPDPADAAVLLEYGYSTLLYSDAAYALPEWRPDHTPGVQAWSDLEREITTQRALREADKRMEEEVK